MFRKGKIGDVMATRSEAGEPEDLSLLTLFLKECDRQVPTASQLLPHPLPLSSGFLSFFFLSVSVPPFPSSCTRS